MGAPHCSNPSRLNSALGQFCRFLRHPLLICIAYRHWAAAHGFEACCALLQAAGGDVDEPDRDGLTPQECSIPCIWCQNCALPCARTHPCCTRSWRWRAARRSCCLLGSHPQVSSTALSRPLIQELCCARKLHASPHHCVAVSSIRGRLSWGRGTRWGARRRRCVRSGRRSSSCCGERTDPRHLRQGCTTSWLPQSLMALRHFRTSKRQQKKRPARSLPRCPTRRRDGLAMNHCLRTEMVPKPDTVTTFGIRRARNRPVWQEACRTRTLAQAHPPRQGEGAP
jgi:hypothetical protein